MESGTAVVMLRQTMAEALVELEDLASLARNKGDEILAAMIEQVTRRLRHVLEATG